MGNSWRNIKLCGGVGHIVLVSKCRRVDQFGVDAYVVKDLGRAFSEHFQCNRHRHLYYVRLAWVVSEK